MVVQAVVDAHRLKARLVDGVGLLTDVVLEVGADGAARGVALTQQEDDLDGLPFLGGKSLGRVGGDGVVGVHVEPVGLVWVGGVGLGGAGGEGYQ